MKCICFECNCYNCFLLKIWLGGEPGILANNAELRTTVTPRMRSSSLAVLLTGLLCQIALPTQMAQIHCLKSQAFNSKFNPLTLNLASLYRLMRPFYFKAPKLKLKIVVVSSLNPMGWKLKSCLRRCSLSQEKVNNHFGITASPDTPASACPPEKPNAHPAPTRD